MYKSISIIPWHLGCCTGPNTLTAKCVHPEEILALAFVVIVTQTEMQISFYGRIIRGIWCCVPKNFFTAAAQR